MAQLRRLDLAKWSGRLACVALLLDMPDFGKPLRIRRGRPGRRAALSPPTFGPITKAASRATTPDSADNWSLRCPGKGLPVQASQLVGKPMKVVLLHHVDQRQAARLDRLFPRLRVQADDDFR